MAEESARISPTAHDTSQVWVRHGLSPCVLGTWLGALHAAFAGRP